MQNLTLRGRALLALGLIAGGAGWGLHEPAIEAVAVLLVLLPVIGVLMVRRSRFVLGSARTVQPAQLQVGSEAEVVLVVENGSRLASGVLLLEDRPPASMGEPVHLMLDRVAPRAQRSVRYPIMGRQRGRARVGPLAVTVTDPFGMASMTRMFTATNPVLITPRIVPLHGNGSSIGPGGHGETMFRSVSARGDDDVLPREHHPGDDMRRIHWRATARHGDLMVRREEQAWHSSLAVILDTRDRAHHGSGGSSTFEWAVSAAASIAIHHLRVGWRVTVLTSDGRLLAATAGSAGVEAETLLQAFADVRLGSEPMARTLMSSAEGASAVIAVVGRITEDATETLLRPRSGFAGCLLLAPGPADHLAARGWQVSTWTPATPVEAAWARLSPAGRAGSSALAQPARREVPP
jgi:uncharacterized protein (DUF58 family)